MRRILLNEMKKLINSNDIRYSANNENNNFIESYINEYIGKLWLKSTELARNAGMLQQAHSYILNAQEYQPKNLFIEKAKLFWKSDQNGSFKILERGLEEICPLSDYKLLDNQTRKIYAEGKLLVASYNAKSMNIGSELNAKYFKSAIEVYSESEINMLKLAQYLDSVYAAMSSNDQLSENTLQLDIMTYYGKSMLYGCNYIYQSMPRMLSIWLDFTAQMLNKNNATASKMCEVILKFAGSLPPFLFFTAFSQLVSRICHPSAEVYNVLKTIIVILIQNFPQQSMWMILSVYKSSYTSRIKKCTEIFAHSKLATNNFRKLINDFNIMAELLIELTNKELTTKSHSLNFIYAKLPNLLSNKDFSKILMPIKACMQPNLPPPYQRDKSAKSFNAFPQHSIYIYGIKDDVLVLPSLQRPRRV